jgi:hypothetical protein
MPDKEVIFIKELARYKISPPSSELRCRVLKEAANAMNQNTKEASPEEFRKCIKFFFESVAIFVVLLIAGNVISVKMNNPNYEKIIAAPSQYKPFIDNLNGESEKTIAIHMMALEKLRIPSTSFRIDTHVENIKQAMDEIKI